MRGSVLIYVVCQFKTSYIVDSYKDLIMRVLTLPSLRSPYLSYHFEINISLSVSLVLLCKKFAHSWLPQKSLHFHQNSVYESRIYAVPLW